MSNEEVSRNFIVPVISMLRNTAESLPCKGSIFSRFNILQSESAAF